MIIQVLKNCFKESFFKNDDQFEYCPLGIIQKQNATPESEREKKILSRFTDAINFSLIFNNKNLFEVIIFISKHQINKDKKIFFN